MARISKEFQERYDEIIETSLKLFQMEGYENTSVGMIIDKVGISKGTFYYYFESKRDLMISVIKRISDKILSHAYPIIEDESLSALEKVNQVFEAMGQHKLEEKELMLFLAKIIYNENNAYLLRELNRHLLQFWKNEFSKIIEQGNREGVFSVEDPQMTAVMIFAAGEGLAIHSQVVEGEMFNNPDNLADMLKTYLAYQHMIERTLGAPDKSIRLVDEELLISFLHKDK
ncbi:MAG: TetR/AcrR family transcriptional regulator [Candidatus Cloacimonetes bacterium]|nr:TetR/AcrR family transcriptional regulator [Candidatus Cloacimonadota bacterium]